MLVTQYTLDGNEIESGQYCPLTKSLYRAAIDTGYPIIEINQRRGWCTVGMDKVRMVISKESK